MEENENENCPACEETPGGCAGYIAHADAETPVDVKVKKKRTSKTWFVTVNTGTEEYVMTIKGVTSAEEATQKALGLDPSITVVSVKPARTFK